MQRAQQKKRKLQQQKEMKRSQKARADGEAPAEAAADSAESESEDESPAQPEPASATSTITASAASSSAAPPASGTLWPSPAYPPASSFLRVKPGNFSRLVYSNPVCLLTSSRPAAAAAAAALPSAAAASVEATVAPAPCSSFAGPSRNVMTISWLTATSNHGELVLSMNASRYTAQLVAAPGAVFVLNVPVAGMEAMVRAVGGCSGADGPAELTPLQPAPAAAHSHAATSLQPSELVSLPPASSSTPVPDKFQRLGLPLCRPGNKPLEGPPAQPAGSAHSAKQRQASQLGEAEADAEDRALDLLALPNCVAHLVCEVSSLLPAAAPEPCVRAHNVLFCRVRRAYVLRDYWRDGCNFIPVRAGLPPYLTFLGSGNFGHVVATSNK